MRITKVKTIFSLIALAGLSQIARAEESKTNATTPSKPLTFGITKAKPDKVEIDKATIPNVLPNDKKPTEVKIETKPARVVKDRTPGTVTMKPLTVNFGALTIGMNRKSLLINGYPKDAYQSSFAAFSNRGDTIGTSYDFEMGVMITSSIEAFMIMGIDYQRPVSKVTISNNNPAPFGQFDEFTYDFKSRRNYNFSLGGRYYWNTQKPWFPFVGLMGTAIFQDAVRTIVFQQPNPFLDNYVPIGPLTLQGRKRLWSGTLQAGADYQFNDLVALTFVVGLQYTPRARVTYSSIGGEQISCRDNRSLWSLPVMAALKFTF